MKVSTEVLGEDRFRKGRVRFFILFLCRLVIKILFETKKTRNKKKAHPKTHFLFLTIGITLNCFNDLKPDWLFKCGNQRIKFEFWDRFDNQFLVNIR
jgi:hypothetical protein